MFHVKHYLGNTPNKLCSGSDNILFRSKNTLKSVLRADRFILLTKLLKAHLLSLGRGAKWFVVILNAANCL